MQVYKKEYVEMNVDAQHSILHDKWNKASGRITEKEVKETLLEWKKLMIQHKITDALIDTADMVFTIVPELQAWIDNNVLKPTLDAGFLKRRAIVLSADIFTQVSVQQVMDEEGGKNMPTRFFDNADDARKWLIAEQQR